MKIHFILGGLANALYLTFIHFKSTTSCSDGLSCGDVLSSVFSAPFGIPLAAIGVSLFLFLLGLEVFKKKGDLSIDSYYNFNLYALLPATALAVVLLGVQWLYIGSFCPFCVLNSSIIFILFALLMFDRKTPHFRVNASLPVWVSLSVIILLPMVYVFGASRTVIINTSIATISGQTITEGQFRRSKYYNDALHLERKIRDVKKGFVHQQILELEAKKNNLSVQKYMGTVVFKSINITEDEIKTFYDENKHQLKKGETYAQVKRGIRHYLLDKKQEETAKAHIQGLMTALDVRFTLDPISKVKVKNNNIGYNAMGSKSAPVHIIEFADLECGHC